VTPP
jgi:hypothetical protein